MENNTPEKGGSHARRNIVLTLSVMVASLFGFAGATLAAPPVEDPTGGALADAQTSIQDWVTTYAVPVVFGLLLFGALIRLGIKWFRRAAKTV